MRRKLQDTFNYSKNSSSRKPNPSPPVHSSFAVEITTPYLFSYSSITTSTPAPPIKSIKATVLPYSGKGYIITDEYPKNLIPVILPAYLKISSWLFFLLTPKNLIPVILPA